MIAGITRGVNSRCSVQCCNLKSGIIGKTVIAVMLLDVTGFLEGVSLKSIGCFWNIIVAVDVIQREHLEAVSKYLADLLQFVCVICGKYQLHHSYLEYDVHDLARYNNHLADGLTVNVTLSLLIGQNGILNLLLCGIGGKVHSKACLAVE